MADRYTRDGVNLSTNREWVSANDYDAAIARAKKAEARSEAEAKDYDTACETIAELERRLAAMTKSRDRLVAYVMADDALFLAAVSNSPERFALDKARRAARAAVDAAGDLAHKEVVSG